MPPSTRLLLRCQRHARPQHATLVTVGRRGYAVASTRPEIYDVVCVGGGPAGLSLLSALRSSPITSNLRIAMIEGQDLQRSRLHEASPSSYSNRCSSLTPASAGFLKDIGAWQHIDSSRVQPYHEMQVWDGVSGARISFDWDSASALPFSSPKQNAASPASSTIAYMTENLNLTSALLARLDELGGVSVYDKTRVEDIQLGEETDNLDLRSWPLITLSSGKTLAARLLVGADGANSPVRTFAGIDSRGWDYERHGVVATVQLDGHGWGGDAVKTAYQRFLPTGPVALLPLPGAFSTLVWSTLPQHAAHLKTLSPPDFTAMVNAAFRLSPTDLAYMHTLPSGQASELAWREPHTPFDPQHIPQRITDVQPNSTASFPLKMRHAATYTGERVALLGDAAHTIHPLAGQGLNQGQGDAAALAATISTAVAAGMDIGSTLALESYNAERYQANNLLLGVVDKLHKLYSVGSGPVVWGRSWGLKAVDGLGVLKGFFMRRAAGVR